MNIKKNGFIILWIGLLIASIILLFDKNNGLWTYIGSTILLISSLCSLFYYIFKKK